MRLLLDTHALLWWLADDPRLVQPARDVIADPANDILVPAASLWKIQVKVRVGKLKTDIQDILSEMQEQGFDLLAIAPAHLVALGVLPRHPGDPWDHLLIAPASGELADVAAAVAAGAPRLRLDGVMTHAGHSYALDDITGLQAMAEAERAAVVSSAEMLRSLGHPCPIVSIGSTPTVLHASHLRGVTEARAVIYLFSELAQISRGLSAEADIAVSVLATVIGHQKRGLSLVLDAGALALSKDLGANRFLPGEHYGRVCDARTLRRHGTLSV